MMQKETKKRRTLFVGIAVFSAMVFSFLLFVFAGKTLEPIMFLLSVLAGLATGLSAWLMWTLIMKTAETKFRGAWCGVFTVVFAYPLLAIFMSVLDKSAIGTAEYIMITTLFGITMTGIFTIPLGGFLGHKIARNLREIVDNDEITAKVL